MSLLHKPVMLAQVLDAVAPRDGSIYIDATFGRGGYTEAVLAAADCRVLAIDRDPDAITAGRAAAGHFSGRLTLLSGRFSQLATLASHAGFDKVDGVMFDLGLSSPQIDEVERGFSFRKDGPLDMRMEKSGPSASDFINSASENEIASVLREYGEERAARRIAKAIVAARSDTPITRTTALADIIRDTLPTPKPNDIDPATRSFQAIRIRINDELGELASGLKAAETILKPGGILAVVSFHSLEDRIVKRFLVARSDAAPMPSRHLPVSARPAPSFRLKRKHPSLPDAAETELNPRARSAKLRVAVRTDAPAIMEAA